MSKRRCPHFAFRVDSVEMAGLPKPQSILIFQCVAADAIATRLRSLSGSDALLNPLELTAQEGTQHTMCGPDRKPCGTKACTHTRWQQECLPAFVEMMTDLGLDPTPP